MHNKRLTKPASCLFGQSDIAIFTAAIVNDAVCAKHNR